MAGSSSDSSELRHYLNDLRSRTTQPPSSPSRIPRRTEVGEQKPVDERSRASALLDRVAKLATKKQQKSTKKLQEVSSSPPTTSQSSKKEVAFDLSSTRPKSRIPQSPRSCRSEVNLKSKKVNETSSSPKKEVLDSSRHQSRRSPSPYHKNCQHSSQLSAAADSPEPERGRSSPKTTPRKKKTTVTAPPPPATVTDTRRSSRPTINEINSLASSSSSGTSDHHRTSVNEKQSSKTEQYSDTFEESTGSKLNSSSIARRTRSKSLDTELRTTTKSSKSIVSASRSASRRRSSTTAPDWWFPGILPPQHFGGNHLEQLQRLHLGVLDDVFRFQMGLIEKHQQRNETRYKSVKQFVQKRHSYTSWEDYENDPRTKFVKWQRRASKETP